VQSDGKITVHLQQFTPEYNRMHMKLQLETMRGIDHLAKLGIHGKIILKWI
jgi:hypothetical protein